MTRRRLMFLSHRPPFPPDKGEKIRAWHVLRHLARDFDIHLGCVANDPADLAELGPLRALCADVAAVPVSRRAQTARAVLRARPGYPLMPGFYASSTLRRWVDATMARQSIDLIYIYTVAMAPYVERQPRHRKILDAVDIDSEKWRQYAADSAWPMRALWAREARTLLAYERRAASASAATLFVSAAEADHFTSLAPEARNVDFVENGVDLAHFSPAHHFPRPLSHPGPALVFTGHMDYAPNAEAVIWFANRIMPRILAAVPAAQFWIVGANPGAEVQRLGRHEGVTVTGRVPDTRPFMAHAAACVCPLRLARGIQNKVLEGMAMGRPVIATPQAFLGIRAVPGRDLLVAETEAGFAEAVLAVLRGEHAAMGDAARAAMQAGYSWDAALSRLDTTIERVLGSGARPLP